MKRGELRRLGLGVIATAMLVQACGPDDTSTITPKKDQGTVVTMDMEADTGTSPEDLGGQDAAPDLPDEVDEGTPDADMGPPDLGPEDMGDPDMSEDMGTPDMMDMMMPPEPCQTNSDCSAPEICVFDAQSGERTCQDPTGVGMTGDMCTSGADCASNLCVNNVCANPCQGDADCPGGFICESQSIPLDGGGSVSLDVCVEAPQSCLADSDCTSPEICTVSATMGNSVVLTCEDPVPGKGDVGDVCAQDSECLSGICEAGICSKPCQRPIDCSADGSFICEPSGTLTSNGSPLNICVPRPATQCLSNSQCGSPEQCIASRGAAQIDFTCGDTNPNGGGVGASCAADSDCAQNLCLGGVCATPCQSNGDCSAAADFTCELQGVTLSGGAMDSVQVCTPPVACTSRNACKINEACYARRDAQGLDTICRQPNVGGGSLGQVCNMDSECASNLCLQTRFGKVCSLPCDTASQCNVAGYTCRQADVATSTGGTAQERVCAPSAPAACTSNSACQTGTSCAIVPNEAGNALESICIPSTGKLATGVACNSDNQCESRVCLGGSCAAPCTDSNQCGPRQLCLNNDITKSGVTQSFDVCERLADQSCTSTDSCTDGVRVCSEIRTAANGSIDAFCAFPNNSGALLGEDCTSNVDCRENICLSTIDECSVVCDEDSDCSLAENQICSTFLFPQSNTLDLCVRGCTDNASCNAGDVCTINDDVTNNDIDQICSDPAGAGELGDVCVNGGDCDTGLCLTTVLYNGVTCNTNADCSAANGETCRCPIDQPNCMTGKQCATSSNRCSRICNDDTDCAGGTAGNQLTTCSTDVNVTLPDGNGTKELSLCGQSI